MIRLSIRGYFMKNILLLSIFLFFSNGLIGSTADGIIYSDQFSSELQEKIGFFPMINGRMNFEITYLFGKDGKYFEECENETVPMDERYWGFGTQLKGCNLEEKQPLLMIYNLLIHHNDVFSWKVTLWDEILTPSAIMRVSSQTVHKTDLTIDFQHLGHWHQIMITPTIIEKRP